MIIKKGDKRGYRLTLAQAWSNKRGSHVGVIASFAVFVMFLIGLYMVTQPALKTQKDKDLFLEYLEIELKNQFSNNLTTAILSPGGPTIGECEYINLWDIELLSILGPPIVKDKNGNILDSGVATSSTFYFISTGEANYWLYGSQEFTTKAKFCAIYIPALIKSVRVEKRLFESRIVNGIGNYSTTLRGNLTIPANSDFSVGFQYNNGTIISAGEKNVTTNILAKEIPIQYVDRNATLLSGKLIVKVW